MFLSYKLSGLIWQETKIIHRWQLYFKFMAFLFEEKYALTHTWYKHDYVTTSNIITSFQIEFVISASISRATWAASLPTKSRLRPDVEHPAARGTETFDERGSNCSSVGPWSGSRITDTVRFCPHAGRLRNLLQMDESVRSERNSWKWLVNSQTLFCIYIFVAKSVEKRNAGNQFTQRC